MIVIILGAGTMMNSMDLLAFWVKKMILSYNL